ncbi:MAG: CPBP family glutamic-type intramembrane protease [Pseudomonadota bacterium]
MSHQSMDPAIRRDAWRAVAVFMIFTIVLVPKGITFAYITFKSNSLWPAAILHASHNLFIQRIFTPLTTPGEGTHLYIDEFGIMMPILGLALAIYFYRRAVKEGIA